MAKSPERVQRVRPVETNGNGNGREEVVIRDRGLGDDDFGSMSDVVVVASKLPNGLIMQCSRPEETFEASAMGMRQMKIGRKFGPKYVLNPVQIPFGARPEFASVGGFSLTTIPRKFWEIWSHQHRDADYIINGLVWALPSEADARAKAKEFEKKTSGLEPLDPANPPRSVGRHPQIKIEQVKGGE